MQHGTGFACGTELARYAIIVPCCGTELAYAIRVPTSLEQCRYMYLYTQAAHKRILHTLANGQHNASRCYDG